MLVGLVGFIGSGKGTVGDILVEKGYQKDSFARPLKDACSVIFGWDRKLLEGDTKESREWREHPDEFWSDAFGHPFTPRTALQILGTEGCRNNIHKDIWVHSLLKRASTKNTVVSDVRFRNEIKMIHDHGGKIVRVKRGPEPEWFDDAIRYNRGPRKNFGWANAKYKLQDLNIHSSEIDWVGCPIDYTIENNGTLEDLGNKVDDLLQFIKNSV